MHGHGQRKAIAACAPPCPADSWTRLDTRKKKGLHPVSGSSSPCRKSDPLPAETRVYITFAGRMDVCSRAHLLVVSPGSAAAVRDFDPCQLFIRDPLLPVEKPILQRGPELRAQT